MAATFLTAASKLVCITPYCVYDLERLPLVHDRIGICRSVSLLSTNLKYIRNSSCRFPFYLVMSAPIEKSRISQGQETDTYTVQVGCRSQHITTSHTQLLSPICPLEKEGTGLSFALVSETGRSICRLYPSVHQLWPKSNSMDRHYYRSLMERRWRLPDK